MRWWVVIVFAFVVLVVFIVTIASFSITGEAVRDGTSYPDRKTCVDSDRGVFSTSDGKVTLYTAKGAVSGTPTVDKCVTKMVKRGVSKKRVSVPVTSVTEYYCDGRGARKSVVLSCASNACASSSACAPVVVPAPTPVQVCGNAVREGSESCDLGSANNGVCPKTCSTTCMINSCTTPATSQPLSSFTYASTTPSNGKVLRSGVLNVNISAVNILDVSNVTFTLSKRSGTTTVLVSQRVDTISPFEVTFSDLENHMDYFFSTEGRDRANRYYLTEQRQVTTNF